MGEHTKAEKQAQTNLEASKKASKEKLDKYEVKIGKLKDAAAKKEKAKGVLDAVVKKHEDAFAAAESDLDKATELGRVELSRKDAEMAGDELEDAKAALESVNQGKVKLVQDSKELIDQMTTEAKQAKDELEQSTTRNKNKQAKMAAMEAKAGLTADKKAAEEKAAAAAKLEMKKAEALMKAVEDKKKALLNKANAAAGVLAESKAATKSFKEKAGLLNVQL